MVSCLLSIAISRYIVQSTILRINTPQSYYLINEKIGKVFMFYNTYSHKNTITI